MASFSNLSTWGHSKTQISKQTLILQLFNLTYHRSFQMWLLPNHLSKNYSTLSHNIINTLWSQYHLPNLTLPFVPIDGIVIDHPHICIRLRRYFRSMQENVFYKNIEDSQEIWNTRDFTQSFHLCQNENMLRR